MKVSNAKKTTKSRALANESSCKHRLKKFQQLAMEGHASNKCITAVFSLMQNRQIPKLMDVNFFHETLWKIASPAQRLGGALYCKLLEMIFLFTF